MSRTHWFASLLSVVLLAATATPVHAEDADYIIRVTYDGPLVLHEVEVLLYDTDRACDKLVEDPWDPPDVAWTSLIIQPDAEGNIPDRALDVPSSVVLHYAVARGEPSNGAGDGVGYFATFGCNDQIPVTDPAQATVIEIDMHNLWPSVEGTYRIDQRMDALDRLPWHVRFAANSVKEFTNDPGLGVLRLFAIADAGERYWDTRPWRRYFTCEGYDTFRGVDYCTQVNPTAAGLRQVGRLTRHMDANLAEFWAVPEASLHQALRSARDAVLAPTSIGLSGNLVITNDADQSGYLGNSNSVAFNQVTWHWEGGERTFELRNTSYPRGSNIAASIVFHPDDPETYSLAVDRHGVALSYGELLIWALEGVGLPEALGETADGGDRVDGSQAISTFEQFFAVLLECEALPRALTEPCWLLSETAGEALTIWSTSPVPEIESWATWGTPIDDPCQMSPAPGSQEFRMQTLGGPSPANQCAWSGELTLLPGPIFAPLDARWWGDRL
jgi:hypothetical protein